MRNALLVLCLLLLSGCATTRETVFLDDCKNKVQVKGRPIGDCAVVLFD